MYNEKVKKNPQLIKTRFTIKIHLWRITNHFPCYTGGLGVAVACQHSLVRLVSSGNYFNSVTFLYSNLTADEIGREDPNKCTK